MINGVIFDMDGLMFDTERMWATFWKPALAALGLEYKEGLAEAERGTAGETSRNIVRQFYGEDCDATPSSTAAPSADEEFQKPVPKKPGLDELLAWLDANHIPMAVASSSRVHVIEGNLNNWGLTHYFKRWYPAAGQTLQARPGDLPAGGGKAGHRPRPHAGAGGQLQRRAGRARGGFVTMMVPDLAPPTRDAPSVHRRVQRPARGEKDAGGGEASFRNLKYTVGLLHFHAKKSGEHPQGSLCPTYPAVLPCRAGQEV